jgi:hypothetical protein
MTTPLDDDRIAARLRVACIVVVALSPAALTARAALAAPQAPPPGAGDAATGLSAGQDVDGAFLRGTAAFRAGRLDEAAEMFALASRLDPQDADSALMEGIARARLGQADRARPRLQAAIRLGLPEADLALAEEFLQMVEGDRSTEPDPWSRYLIAAIGGGVDSNVALESLGGAEMMTLASSPRNGSPFAAATLIAGVDWHRGAFSTGIGFAFLQNAYLAAEWDGLSFQSNGLEWSSRLQVVERVRLSLAARADLSASGLRSGYSPFQLASGIEPAATFRQAPWAETRVSGSLLHKRALDSGFLHLAGWRFEATLTQEFRVSGWTVAGTLRGRREALAGREDAPSSTPSTPTTCAGCRDAFVIPYSYVARMASLRIGSPAQALFRAGLSARFEDRPYDASMLERRTPSGGAQPVSYSTRRDRRLAGGVDLHLGRSWGLGARYDVLTNHSEVRSAGDCEGSSPACPPVAAGAGDYLKHVFTLELEAAWF